MVSDENSSGKPAAFRPNVPIAGAEMIQLLSEAADLEHSIACQYLFAAYSLKQPGDDTGIPDEQWTVMTGIQDEQWAVIEGWSETLLSIATQEMRHLAQVFNLIIALGATPVIQPTPFPQHSKYFSLGMEAVLTPFSLQTVERFIQWEAPASALSPLPSDHAAYLDSLVERARTQNPAAIHHLVQLQRVGRLIPPDERTFGSIGELYSLIDDMYPEIERTPRMGVPGGGRAITNKRVPFVDPLTAIGSKDDASRAIGLIIEESQGMGQQAGEQSHYQRLVDLREQLQGIMARQPAFAPARPVVENPIYVSFGNLHHAVPGANIITDRIARRLGVLFADAYEIMLQLVIRPYLGIDDDDVDLLLNAAMSLMHGVLRPLGITLTALPAGREHPGLMAGPSFEPYSNAQPLPGHAAAWRYFSGRLQDLAIACQDLNADPDLTCQRAGEAHQLTLANVAAVLQFWVGRFRPPSNVGGTAPSTRPPIEQVTEEGSAT
jgi:hypothetical protein